MPLTPLDFSATLEAFDQAIMVYETDGAVENHRWKQSQGQDRTIHGVLIVGDPEKLQLMTSGAVSGGGIVIHTPETLYFQDPKSSTVTESKQSFVRFQGYIYRVVTKAFQDPNANFNTYVAERYQARGSDGTNINN